MEGVYGRNPEEAKNGTHKSKTESKKKNLKNGKLPFTDMWELPPVEEIYKILDLMKKIQIIV